MSAAAEYGRSVEGYAVSSGLNSRAGALLVSGGVISVLILTGLTGTGQATFPGTNGLIVYENPRSGDLYTIRPDGTHRDRLAMRGTNSDPAFSASGRRIVFSHIAKSFESSSIVVVNRSGGDPHTVIREHGVHFFDPSFSPNGRRIVFMFKYQVWGVRRSGSHMHELGGATRHNFNPSYSPNGRLIVWNGSNRIAVTRTVDLHQHTLARGPHFGEPSFAPDGKHILFTGGRTSIDAAETNVLEMGLRGFHRRNVTADAGASFVYHSPEFSPDGTRIVVVKTNPSPECNLCDSLETMDPDGGERQLVTARPSVSPDWGPAVGSHP